MIINKSLDIKDIQTISLQILKKITDICENNSFHYCLAYGTLLGAIRHNGYIPWDDDVDILMPRPDYELLLNYLNIHKSELDDLEVFNPETCQKYPFTITRISDCRTIIQTNNVKDCNMGVFVDIYPYDGIGNDEENAKQELFKCNKYRNLMIIQSKERMPISKSSNIKDKISFILQYAYYKIQGRNYIYDKIKKIISKYDWHESEYVGCLAWAYAPPSRALFRRTQFENCIKHKFEKYDFYVPKDYDNILKQIYGNYMELPPIQKRVYHHAYKAYKK